MSLLLARGQSADLVLDGGWRTTVLIESADSGTAHVRAGDGELRLPERLDWTAATLEWTTEDGTIRRPGILVDDESAGTLRLLAIGDRAFAQRRRGERVPVAVDAVLRTRERTLEATTVNVSAGGMLLGGVDGFDAPTEIDFTLSLSGAAVRGAGMVVRGMDDGSRGVRFDRLDGLGSSTLEQWLDARLTMA